MAPITLTDLPPELLDHITAYIPTARSLTSLGATSRALHDYVQNDAWKTFNRTRFPSLHPLAPPSQHDAARTLTTLSRAWSRRAFVARYVEPGPVRTYPGGGTLAQWKRPRGQTIGFTPQLDVYEEQGPTWRDRSEVLAFSAGAGVCVRRTQRRGGGAEEVRWMTYRPLSAYEGRDDVTTLHLLPSGDPADGQQLITGTANGDLRLVRLCEGGSGDVPISYFVTNGQPVRSSSVLQRPGEQSLLVSNTGDSRISLYPVDAAQPKIAPSSVLDIRPPPRTGSQTQHQRLWSTQFLSPAHVIAGLGPSASPLHIYALTPTGLSPTPTRILTLQTPTTSPEPKPFLTSVYPTCPLPPSNAASASIPGTVFLSGAWDGIVRLHDLRSPRDVEARYTDPTDDSAVYSLLVRGRETVLAGTAQHNLVKVFDLRLGAKCYDYLEAAPAAQPHDSPLHTTNDGSSALASLSLSDDSPKPRAKRDWNLFLRPHNINNNDNTNASAHSNSSRGRGRGGGAGNHSNWNRRAHDSSVYSLASPSPASPFVYAGVENAVLELGFTGVADRYCDTAFFPPAGEREWGSKDRRGGHGNRRSSNDAGSGRVHENYGKGGEEVEGLAGWDLDLAMYGQATQMKLFTQRGVGETFGEEGWRAGGRGGRVGLEWLDERWRVRSGAW
ncbi:hypothetical protein LTR08_002423 [Meristemomyces frigidus]|nr:hypothetical protein LTR08_002423 [Meristemomyces frigidus]